MKNSDPWKTTSCMLCAQNCGLLVRVEENRITRVKGDRSNPRSQGYVCRKGVNVANHQHGADRLTHPLKKTDQGFVKISWEQAFSEIAARLRSILDDHSPKALAYMGGGGQGCHFEAAFGPALLAGLGSKYHYNAIAQEFTGYFWACGRMFGSQNRFPIPDEQGADMILAVGWNGMVSHQMPRAPLVLREFSRNPEKLLAVIDPRKSETARMADLHLDLRPGTDALLARAMVALILENGWEDRGYIEAHTTGFEAVAPWFHNFPIKDALAVCRLDYDAVYGLCRELSRRQWCLHFDLGVYMNRHSTLTTYLYTLLSAICGRISVPGGDVIPGALMRLGTHTDERKPETWRTVVTNFPAIVSLFPPNVMPEEILNEKPDRLRAVIVSGANPLRSYADTGAYERAFEKLDLLVAMELAMTETAELADYVLPARSAFESYDSTFFTWNFPDIYFQMRPPVLEPAGDALEIGEIFTRLADKLGLIPQIPPEVIRAAKKSRLDLAAALFAMVHRNPSVMERIPFVLAKVLGPELKSAHLAMLWGMLLTAPGEVRAYTARAGFPPPSIFQSLRNRRALKTAITGIFTHRSIAPLAVLAPMSGHAENLFQAIINNPQGLWVGRSDPLNNMGELTTDDGQIHLHIPEARAWIEMIDPEKEERALIPDSAYPLVLNAGRHKPENANTLMRNPAWNKGRRACTLAMHPDDADGLDLVDGEMVLITTEAASQEIELEVTGDVRPGMVLIPHGFGLKYEGQTHGINVNRLTKNTHRDPLAATPIHRYVPCRVEKAGD